MPSNSISKQEYLFGPLMHEINSHSSTEVNLHQVQRTFEALVHKQYDVAQRQMGSQLFAVLKHILSDYSE